jgi:hypothetical protein
MVKIFGFNITKAVKKDNRANHDFTDLDREKSVLEKQNISLMKARNEILAKQTQIIKERLEHKQMMQQQEQLQEQIEDLEDDDDNDYDDENNEELDNPLPTNDTDVFDKILLILSKVFIPKPINSSSLTPIQAVQLTDEQITEQLTKVPADQLNNFRKLDVDTQKMFLKQNFKNYNEETINRAINLINKI